MTDSPTRRVALYARVSTKQHGQDPETQLFPLRDMARLRQFEVIGEYVDVGISGSRERRPQLDRLMVDAKRRRFDAVLVARFDRFARSVSHLLRALDDFNKLGIDFVSLNESIDTSTPVGKLVFTILGAVAEMERSLIQERVKAGVDRAKKQGKKLGRPRVLVDEVKVCEAIEAGETVKAVAIRWAIARGTVEGILQKRGVKKPQKDRAKSPLRIAGQGT